MAEIRIENKDDLKAWLETRDQTDAITFASRAALRALPDIVEIFDDELENARSSIILPVFRATHASAVTRWAIVTAEAKSAASAAAHSAASAALSADSAARSAARSAHSAAWKLIEDEATLLAKAADATSLISRPLWPEGAPDWARDNWARLEAELRAAENEDWGVWIDWYEGQLAGQPAPDLALEEAILLIPDETWNAGAKTANAEIRRLMDEHASKPEFPDLVAAVSPQPSLESHILGVEPNRVYDAPEASDELASLPQRQRSLIRTMMTALEGNGNIPDFVSFALEEYSEELLVRGTRPFLGILNDQHQVVRDEYVSLNKNGFIEKDGVRRLFLQFSANHRQIKENFPLDAKREAMYVRCLVDWARVDVGTVRTLATDFSLQAQALGEAGLASADFVKVSISIATDLRSAIDHIPTSSNAVVEGTLRWQDRAVIRAMCFPDAARKKIRESQTMDAIMASQSDISFVMLSERIAQELMKVVF